MILHLQSSQHDLQFQTRLVIFALRVRTSNNTTACKKSSGVAIDQARTQRYCKFAMTTRTNPTERSRVPSSVQLLGISYGRKCSLTGEPTDSWCRMQMGHHIQDAATWKQLT